MRGLEYLWHAGGAAKGLHRKLCALEEEFALLTFFWYPLHCIPDQLYPWGATNPIPLIYGALAGPGAVSALGMGMRSGSVRQSVPSPVHRGWAYNPNRPWIP